MRLAKFTVKGKGIQIAVPPSQYVLLCSPDKSVQLASAHADDDCWNIEEDFEKACIEMDNALSETTCSVCGNYLSQCDQCKGLRP